MVSRGKHLNKDVSWKRQSMEIRKYKLIYCNFLRKYKKMQQEKVIFIFNSGMWMLWYTFVIDPWSIVSVSRGLAPRHHIIGRCL